MKPKQRTFAQVLSNEMTACCDTGNLEQARQCLALLKAYVKEGKVDPTQAGDIKADFRAAFPDA